MMANQVSKDDLKAFMMTYPEFLLEHPNFVDDLYMFLQDPDTVTLADYVKQTALQKYPEVKKLGEAYQKLELD